MKFFYLKKNVLFSRYLDFGDFGEFLNFKMCNVAIDISAHQEHEYNMIVTWTAVIRTGIIRKNISL